jgi:hypothetical protein
MKNNIGSESGNLQISSLPGAPPAGFFMSVKKPFSVIT